MLFESILLVTAHQILSSASSHSGDSGVGRYNINSKNAVILLAFLSHFRAGEVHPIHVVFFYLQIVFHDINITTLVGADLEKV